MIHNEKKYKNNAIEMCLSLSDNKSDGKCWNNEPHSTPIMLKPLHKIFFAFKVNTRFVFICNEILEFEA